MIHAIDHYHSREVWSTVVFSLLSLRRETCLHFQGFIEFTPLPAPTASKAPYRFLSADEIKKTAVCVWCAFQQRDLPASSRYGLRGESLWGGLNSSLSSSPSLPPPPPPPLLARGAPTACRLLLLRTALPLPPPPLLLTGSNKPGSKVKRDCEARNLVCSSGSPCIGNDDTAGSGGGRARDRRSEREREMQRQDQISASNRLV